MIPAEDPATVLEQFIHDVANLPAEIQHLMEEMEAKEREIQTIRAQINKRDNLLQKFVKLNGSMVLNPNEENYKTFITTNYNRAQLLQEEKIALASKAAALLDRQVKRYDMKLRALENDGQLLPDPSLPSLLRDSPGNLVPPASAMDTGTNTPLQPFPLGAGGGAPNIANAAVARMQMHNNGAHLGSFAGLASTAPSSMLNPNPTGRGSAQPDKKRPRNGAPTHVAMPTGGMRAGSTDRGTPKAGTPGSRAGSVQPNRPSTKKNGVVTHASRKAPPPGQPQPVKKSSTMKSNGSQKKSRRSTAASPTPTEAEDDDEEDEDEEDEGGEEESDDTKYCICQSVSYGDMVACDNADCPYQWFHWGCIGMTKEPVGDWLCSHCQKLPPSQIRRAS